MEEPGDPAETAETVEMAAPAERVAMAALAAMPRAAESPFSADRSKSLAVLSPTMPRWEVWAPPPA